MKSKQFILPHTYRLKEYQGIKTTAMEGVQTLTSMHDTEGDSVHEPSN